MKTKDWMKAAIRVMGTVEGKIILGAAGIGASLLAAFAATKNTFLLGSGLGILITSATSFTMAVRSLLSREETRRQHEETKSKLDETKNELKRTNSRLDEMNERYEETKNELKRTNSRLDEIRDLLKGRSGGDGGSADGGSEKG